MHEEAELLRRYATERSQAAFAELVRRNVDLVYSAALRQVNGATHRAQDVTQSVFVDLARKAHVLANRPDIVGWLYTSTHHAAAKLKRAEQRRQQREQEAHAMEEIHSQPTTIEWERLRPVLDDAMHALTERDREAILLRFFQGRRFAELGARLGVTEDAARMRVERALDRLRSLLVQRGIASTAFALGVALEACAVTAAPPGLATAVAGAAVSATGGTTAGVFAALSAGALPLAALLLLVAGSVAVVAVQEHTNTALRAEIAALAAERQTTGAFRAVNARLARDAAEVQRLRQDDLELVRIRDDANVLRRVLSESQTRVPRDQPGTELVSLRLPDADLLTVFSAYQIYSGKRITRDPSIAQDRSVVTVLAHMIPKAEAMELIRGALRDKANIVLEPAGDGTLRAKRAPAR